MRVSFLLHQDDLLFNGVDYFGNQIFHTAEQMRTNLTNVINYAETNAQASPDIKQKLRYVTMKVLEDRETRAVVVMIACHGRNSFSLTC